MVTRIKPEELNGLFGDMSKVGIRLDQQKENIDYLESNYAKLLEKHRNQWIIVDKGRLAACARDISELFSELSKTGRDDTLLYYLADPEDFMIL